MSETKADVLCDENREHNFLDKTLAESAPFPSILIIGQSHSGKTVLTTELLYQFKKLNKFTSYYLVSPTARLSGDFACIPKKNRIDTFDEAWIEALKADQLRDMEAHKREPKRVPPAERICIIFDDIIANKRVRNSEAFDSLWTLGRHHNIALIVLSQTTKGLNPTARSNAHLLFVSRLRSETQRRFIIEEFLSTGSKKEGEQYFEEKTADTYSFLMIDLRSQKRGLEEFTCRVRLEKPTPKFKLPLQSEARKKRVDFFKSIGDIDPRVRVGFTGKSGAIARSEDGRIAW